MTPDTEAGTFTTQVRKGLLSYCILSLCSDGPVYTSDLLEALKEYEMIVSEGTLYPLLNRLKRDGHLTYQWQESPSGPPRKYYEISESGREHLQVLANEWLSLTKSVKQLENRNKKGDKK